jgi:hypothetical protein
MKQVTDPYTQPMSRRAVLKGLGASMALPFMPSVAWAKKWDIDPTKPPRRWVTLIFTCGVNEDHWWAKGEGKNMRLSKSLKPLERFKEDITVINGLRAKDDGAGFHGDNFANWLNGYQFEGGRNNKRPILPQSIDRHLASTIGKQTLLPGLNLGVEPADDGGVLHSTMSWSYGQTPIMPEIEPRAVFDALFDSAKLEREKSLLDILKKQAEDVRRDLGAQDKRKLEQMMASIRELEQRIERAINDERPAHYWRPELAEPNMKPPKPGVPADPQEHQKIMIDLMVLALRMDKTRVATLVLQNDTSAMDMTFLDGVTKAGLHGNLSHHQFDEDTLRQYQITNEYHVSLCAYAMEKLAAVEEEGDSTLLDNTMLTFGSNMMDGNTHYSGAFPVVLCGGRNCDIKPGRVLDFTDKPVEHRRLMNLHLATAQRMGADLSEFGNSTFPIENLG